MEEAFAAAKEKLTDMVSDFMYRGEAIPPPSLPADIINRRQQDNEQFAGFVVTFVGVVIVSTLPSLCDKAGQSPSGTMSMSYLKRHVYELRTSMDPNIVVKLQSLYHDMARIWVENAEGVCVDTHEVSVHEATGEELTITNEAVRVERSYIIKINKSYVVLFMGSRILKIHKQQQHALFTANGADLKRI
eukprot:gene9825-biopygen7010